MAIKFKDADEGDKAAKTRQVKATAGKKIDPSVHAANAPEMPLAEAEEPPKKGRGRKST